MICHSTLPELFWGEAFKTAAYIFNRLSTKATNRILYEFWTGKKFSLKHLHICKCPLEIRPYRPNKKKLDSRTISYYFIRYSERSRGYKFYDPTIKSIFEIENAQFFEDIEFGGENIVRDVVFKKEYVNIFTCVIDLVQDPILDHDIINQDNIE